MVLSSFGFDRNYRFLTERKITFDGLFFQDIKEQSEQWFREFFNLSHKTSNFTSYQED